MPTLFIIAGPNGVGKTTFADRYLPDEAKQLEFVNADLNELLGPRLLAVEKYGRLVVRDRVQIVQMQREAGIQL